jgi:cytochrome d ubiquinol oxidase subunit II
VPFRLDSDLRSFYEGGLLDLLTPFGLLCGLLSVAMLVLHGAGWLSIKIERGAVHDRARRWGLAAAALSLLLFVAGGLWVAFGDIGYRLTGDIDPAAPSNPLASGAERAPGAWLANYAAAPWMWLAPLLGMLGPLVAAIGIWRRADFLVFTGSSLGAFGIIATAGLSMFPFLLPSSLDPASSLTVWNASSSHLTLWIMFLSVLIFLPLVLLYTAWVFRVLFGRVTSHAVETNPDFY